MTNISTPKTYAEFLPGLGVSAILAGLFERAVDQLDIGELDLLAAGAAEQAQQQARCLRNLAAGIGALVVQDGAGGAGSFLTPDNLSDLMFSVAEVADGIHGLLQLGHEAESVIRNRPIGGGRAS